MTDEKTPLAQDDMPSRRRFLKRAAVALPVVATIPSGAALAQSSNMIGYTPYSTANTIANTPTVGGDIVCLNTQLADVHTDPNVVDLGTPPMLGTPPAVRLPAADTYQPSSGGSAVSAAQACESAETQWKIKAGGTGPKRDGIIPQGVVVSATAMSSFIGLNGVDQLDQI